MARTAPFRPVLLLCALVALGACADVNWRGAFESWKQSVCWEQDGAPCPDAD